MIALAQDRTETIELDLTDQELLVLFKMAHEQDLTFNEFVEVALLDFLEKHQNDSLLTKLDGTSQHGMVQNTWPYPNTNKDWD
jgi:hypothetical protein